MEHNAELLAVDEEIRKQFRRLRFAPALEQQFEADASYDRCHRVIVINYVALVIYHAFLLGDYFAVGDSFTLDVTLHFGVNTPIVLLMHLVLSRRPPTWLREGCMMLANIVLALTIAVVVLASGEPMRDLILFDSVLVILFATIMQRLRFWYSIVTCIVLLGIYDFGLWHLAPSGSDRSLEQISTFIGILLFSVIGSYNLEHETRMGYLLRCRDRISNRELEAVTRRDALTGIGNRRAFEAALLQIEGDVSIGGSTAALMLDIDHFKTFNDMNGHQQGDACLKRVAVLAAGALSTRGAVYRYGGEEFIVLLRDCTIDEAIAVAETIRSAVACAAIARHPDSDAVVTISLGVSAGHVGRDITAVALIAEADRALYVAKRNGRDRIWPAAGQETAYPSQQSAVLLAC